MQLQLAEIVLLVMWSLAGILVSLGCITNHPKLQCRVLFGIENRWGKLMIGVALLGFVVMRLYQWGHSDNPIIYWGL